MYTPLKSVHPACKYLFHFNMSADAPSYLIIPSPLSHLICAPLLCVCRCLIWSDTTTGRRSLCGPLWTPGSWGNAAERYTDHLGETELLVQHFTINTQTISHFLYSLIIVLLLDLNRWNQTLTVLPLPVFLPPCRTAPCRTVSLWTEVCCSCFSSTAACCPLCRWERVYCSSTCRASSTGVAAGVCVHVCVHACVTRSLLPLCSDYTTVFMSLLYVLCSCILHVNLSFSYFYSNNNRTQLKREYLIFKESSLFQVCAAQKLTSPHLVFTCFGCRQSKLFLWFYPLRFFYFNLTFGVR